MLAAMLNGLARTTPEAHPSSAHSGLLLPPGSNEYELCPPCMQGGHNCLEIKLGVSTARRG